MLNTFYQEGQKFQARSPCTKQAQIFNMEQRQLKSDQSLSSHQQTLHLRNKDDKYFKLKVLCEMTAIIANLLLRVNFEIARFVEAFCLE